MKAAIDLHAVGYVEKPVNVNLLAENVKDVEKATANGMAQGMIDRLMLDDNRIEGMAEGSRQVAALPDPVGEVTSMKQRPN